MTNYKGVGIGIFFEDTKEKNSSYIKLNLSIKTTEIIAIFISLKMALAMNKIVIFSDSKSACLSIKNTILS